MIDISNNIRSLNDFKRQSTEFIARLQKDGQPVVLTVNGKAKLVVQDAAGYQRLLKRAEQAEMYEFLSASRAEIEAGGTVSAVPALRRLARKFRLKKFSR